MFQTDRPPIIGTSRGKLASGTRPGKVVIIDCSMVSRVRSKGVRAPALKGWRSPTRGDLDRFSGMSKESQTEKRRGWDSNPRYLVGTHALQACRFVHSRTSPQEKACSFLHRVTADCNRSREVSHHLSHHRPQTRRRLERPPQRPESNTQCFTPNARRSSAQSQAPAVCRSGLDVLPH